MEWVYDRHIITENVSQALDWGVRAGHYNVAQWFVKRFSDEQWPLWSILTSTACGGSLKAWQLLRNGGAGGIDVARYSINLAATYGHLELVQFLANEHDGVLISDDFQRGSLLEAAAASGNLELVKWCVESLGAWTPSALSKASIHGHLTVIEYLYAKGLQRASGAGNDLVHHIDLSAIYVVQMLESGDCAPLIEWILLHVPKEEEIGSVELFMSYHQSSRPSWELMRQLMLYRPGLCCDIVPLPIWAIQRGTVADLKTLEAIGHPRLFTRRTHDVILESTRDQAMMRWFLARCHRLFDVRVVSWAARYICMGSSQYFRCVGTSSVYRTGMRNQLRCSSLLVQLCGQLFDTIR